MLQHTSTPVHASRKRGCSELEASWSSGVSRQLCAICMDRLRTRATPPLTVKPEDDTLTVDQRHIAADKRRRQTAMDALAAKALVLLAAAGSFFIPGDGYEGPALQPGDTPPPAPSLTPYTDLVCEQATGFCITEGTYCVQLRNGGVAPAFPPPGAAWIPFDTPSCIDAN